MGGSHSPLCPPAAAGGHLSGGTASLPPLHGSRGLHPCPNPRFRIVDVLNVSNPAEYARLIGTRYEDGKLLASLAFTQEPPEMDAIIRQYGLVVEGRSRSYLNAWIP